MARRRDPNIYELSDTAERSMPGYRSRRERVGAAAGGRRLGTSVWEVPPGEGAYPYHFHLVDEEHLIVLDGRPLLRDQEGWRRLERGAVVAMLPGAGGGHQIHNDTDELVRFLSVSTGGVPDVVTYPDAGTVAIFEGPPSDGFQQFRLVDEHPYDPGDFAPAAPPTGMP